MFGCIIPVASSTLVLEPPYTVIVAEHTYVFKVPYNVLPFKYILIAPETIPLIKTSSVLFVSIVI